MTKSHFLPRMAVACGLILAALPAAQAQGPSQSSGYYDMCLKAANMPKPFGEWDLKGNAKLPQYCKCFAPLYEARAMKAMQAMQANPGKAPSVEQSNKEELELRNSCRKKLDLPLSVEAKM